MQGITKIISIIEADIGLQFIFGIMLLLLIILAFSFLRRFVNGMNIKPSEGHGLGFFCKNTGKTFPITIKNVHIEAGIQNKLGLQHEVLVRCICGQIHGFHAPVRFIRGLHKERRLQRLKDLRLP